MIVAPGKAVNPVVPTQAKNRTGCYFSSLMTLLFTNSEQILSCGKSRDDDWFGNAAGGGDGITTEASQVIAGRVGGSLDEFQVGTTHAVDVETRTLPGAQRSMLGLVEEVEALDAMTIDRFGCGQFTRRAIAGGEVGRNSR